MDNHVQILYVQTVTNWTGVSAATIDIILTFDSFTPDMIGSSSLLRAFGWAHYNVVLGFGRDCNDWSFAAVWQMKIVLHSFFMMVSTLNTQQCDTEKYSLRIIVKILSCTFLCRNHNITFCRFWCAELQCGTKNSSDSTTWVTYFPLSALRVSAVVWGSVLLPRTKHFVCTKHRLWIPWIGTSRHWHWWGQMAARTASRSVYIAGESLQTASCAWISASDFKGLNYYLNVDVNSARKDRSF